MSATMAVILVAYVLLCGVIAYVGDVLGRKMGKKRISLFHMRPRHTAVLITSVMGGFIALATVYFLITLNRDFRQMVLRGYDQVRELRATEMKLRETRLQVGEQDAVLQNAIARNRALQAEIGPLKTRRDALAEEVAAQSERIAEQNVSIEKQRQAIASQRVAIAGQERRYSELKGRNAWLASQNQTYRAQNDAVSKQNLALNRENSALERQNAQLKQTNASLMTTNGDLQKQNTALTSQNSELQNSNTRLADQNRQLVFNNAELGQENSRLGQERDALLDVLERAKVLQDRYLPVLQGRIVYRYGEEVARRTIACGVPVEVAKEAVHELLSDARKVAEARGAAADESGQSVYIRRKRLPDGTMSSEAQSIDALAEQIHDSTGEAVLVAVASLNTIHGDSVPIEITPYRNKLIFARGAEVAQLRLQSETRTAELFDSLVKFLKSEVRDKVIDAGLIPVKEREGEDGSVGQLDGMQLLNVVDKLRGTRRPIVVSAVAAYDIYAGSQLRLDFKVKSDVR